LSCEVCDTANDEEKRTTGPVEASLKTGFSLPFRLAMGLPGLYEFSQTASERRIDAATFPHSRAKGRAKVGPRRVALNFYETESLLRG